LAKVAVQERLARRGRPSGGCLDPVQDAGRAPGVVERAHHAGDVPERGGLQAPLADGARRLALEIDDVPLVPGPQALAEVVVAVDADLAPEIVALRRRP